MAGPEAGSRPTVVAFDVVETLFSLEPIRARLTEAGLPEHALGEWFSRLLRDAFALDAAGLYTAFREIASGTLEVMLAERGQPRARSVTEKVLQAFMNLPAHPDVRPAFTLLRDAGVRIVTLTNGSAQVTEHLLHRADLDRFVERTFSIDEVRHWKPRSAVYQHAAATLGLEPRRIALVAAHAWDVLGASRAGLVTGWASRREAAFHPAMGSPTVTGRTLSEVAAGLLALGT